MASNRKMMMQDVPLSVDQVRAPCNVLVQAGDVRAHEQVCAWCESCLSDDSHPAAHSAL